MIRTAQYSLSTTTPTELTLNDTIQSANTLVIQNINNTGNIYLGNENVTAENCGFILYPQQSFSIELSAYAHLYALASGVDMTVATMVIERAI